jgi:hypothetical protein
MIHINLKIITHACVGMVRNLNIVMVRICKKSFDAYLN